MATHIHVTGEPTPRLVGFDTADAARYAAGLMGLAPGMYILVEREQCPANVWVRRTRRGWNRSSGRADVNGGMPQNVRIAHS